MTVPLAKVKSLCTDPEVNLVKASRRPMLGQLSVAQTKRNIERAKKYVDKWRDQGRSQSRARSDEVGFPDKDTRTRDKIEIFEDAMKNFEDHLAKLEAAGAEPAPKARKTKPKPTRAKGHRSTRASVRKKLSEKEEVLNQDRATKKKTSPKKKASTKKAASSTKTASPQMGSATKRKTGKKKSKTAAAKRAAKQKSAKMAKKVKSAVEKQMVGGASSDYAGTPTPSEGLNVTKKKQRTTKAAAKRSRIAESGLTTRTRGHVSARTKRSAGRRDSR